MTVFLTEIVSSSFRSLANKYDFRPQNEINDGHAYSVEYVSKCFTVRLEKYRVELYATLYRNSNLDDGVALFNLLAYLAGSQPDYPVAQYFHNEANIEERYRKQITYVAAVLDRYFATINDFFATGDYTSKFADVREFVVRKYPELFKKI